MDILIQPLGRTLNAPPGSNLLELLRGHGVPVSYSCLSGRCGTCRCKVIAGTVLDSGQQAQRPLGLADGQVLACQTVLTEPCTIEIPEPDEVVVHPARTLKCRVVAIDDLTHDIKRLRLLPNKPLDFSAGQYAQLQFTPELSRPYSMAGVCGDETLEFHVRLVPDGRVTGFIANELRVGDSVKLSGPLGTAYLRQRHNGPMLCVAGGTGLAPILSIVRAATEAGMDNPIHIYFGVRAARDVYGLDDLAALRERNPRVQVQVVVASPEEATPLRTGLVTDAVAQDWPRLDGWRAYLCGAPPLVEAASRLVVQRGLVPEHIHADAFYPSGT